MPVSLLEVRGLRRDVGERTILQNISFTLDEGQVVFVRGPSGVGKSLLLRALACLDHAQAGTLLLHGSPPAAVGYPAWRTAVAYVPQSRATSLRGTPAESYFAAQRFAAQRGRPRGDLPALVHALGLEQGVLHQQWGELSGGQAQRVALAISVALGPAVLLLDEPTSACDLESAMRVERVLATCGAALVWATHDPAQTERVGGRLLELPLANITHLPPPRPPPPHSHALQMQMQAGGVAAAGGSGSAAAGGANGAAAAGIAAGGGGGLTHQVVSGPGHHQHQQHPAPGAGGPAQLPGDLLAFSDEGEGESLSALLSPPFSPPPELQQQSLQQSLRPPAVVA
ncbi:hypothetical protein HXX76_013025 [Chlamydomonas incerta]|uniref:ABC transporter domain-containing protein n=1 Tax=Chlamydomonas incerta TaxID=51695 RepID=A0A835VUG2_CHLIN|nr:hypothetical protein HXX76_013025 [Chlamydomonas incerta]|eukprot:KAG2426268.1 hypothetical protein HXX76_013025 [Chlamydomonas incerta]